MEEYRAFNPRDECSIHSSPISIYKIMDSLKDFGSLSLCSIHNRCVWRIGLVIKTGALEASNGCLIHSFSIRAYSIMDSIGDF